MAYLAKNNMDLNQIINSFINFDPVSALFKLFALVFGVLYVIYTFVVYRQTKILVHTLSGRNNTIIVTISFFQIILAIIVFLLAIFI